MAQPTDGRSRKHGTRRRFAYLYFGLLLVGALFFPFLTAIAQERADSSRVRQEVHTLELDRPIQRGLKGGEAHLYQINLTAGQYLHVVIDQRGIDVVATLLGPDGKQIIEVDSPNGTQGPEPISWLTEAAGSYRLEVRSLHKDAPSGRYKVRIEELRTATLQDRDRIAAEKTFAEGNALRAQPKAEFLRKAIAKYEETLPLWRTLGDSSKVANTLVNIGEVYSVFGDNQKTLNYLVQALPLQQAIADKRGEAETLNSIAITYLNMGQLQKGLDYLNQALPLTQAVGDSSGQATTLNAMGSVYNNWGEGQKALDYYGQALILTRAVGNRREEAGTLNNMGSVYSDLGDKPKAIEYYGQAQSLYRAIGDRRRVATTLNNIGMVYNDLGEQQKAIDYLSQALPLYQAVGDRHGEAVTLNNIGLVYNEWGETMKALDYYEQALPLRRATHDRQGEAVSLHNIAAIYNRLGERQKAFDYHHQALALIRAIGDRRREAVTLNNLGSIYRDLGEKQKALDHYSQALSLYRAMADPRGESAALTNIGMVYKDLGEHQQALDYCDRALQLKRAVGDRYGEVNVLNNIGVIYYALDKHQEALDYLGQALALKRTVANRAGEAMTLNNIGVIYGKLGEKQKALDYFGQALQLRRVVGDRHEEAITLAGIAGIELDLGNLIEARARIEPALNIIESLRTKVASPELRTSYFATVQNYYEFYIDLLMQLHQRHPSEGHDAIALQASERARGRSLLEIINEAHVDIRPGADSVLVEREHVLQQQLNTKAERLMRLLGGKHTPEQAATAEKEVAALLLQYQEIQAQIRATSPSYAALTQPQPLSAKEIQQQVLDDETLLLEYALGKERSFLWAVTPTTINSFELPKRAAIDSVARRVYDLLTARNQSRPHETEMQRQARCAQADHELPATAATLSQWLLGPVIELLGNKRLLIVSDGALQYIPFGALPVPTLSVASKQSSVTSAPRTLATDHWPLKTDYRPLIVDHEIIAIPSASVLAVLRRELTARQPAGKTVAALADPVFASDDPRVQHDKKKIAQQAKTDSTFLAGATALASPFLRSAREMGVTDSSEGLARLFFSRREAEGILKLVPVAEGMKAVDFAANRATATSAELSRYRMVHFATHGLLNSTHPELSGIVLSLVDEQGKPQDGFLRLHEIYNLNLPADLVVLSACQTALGKEIRGEGLVGLTRGFMYAGAARVAASLWKVDDRATAELMRRFYDVMLGGKKLRPAAALRAAQISLWKEARWQAPYYWAAFVLQGEWR
ncbi:MAG: tetratricopeptide repeat protein [bacterium]